MNFKMRLSAILLLLVGAAFATTNSGLENGKQYTYKIRSRTMAAINPQANQFTGLLIEGHLVLQPNGQETVRAKITRPRYTQIHSRLDNGWDSEIPSNQKNMQDLTLSNQPFEIRMKNGVVKDLIVDKKVPTWEVNLLKSIVSQLQVDTQGENVIQSHHNQLPENNRPYASFKVMEDTVGGNCEVRYDITPLSERDAQNNPELVPMPELREDGQLIDITKSKNYSNCYQRVSYNFGVDGRNDWEPSANDNRNYLSRSTLSRIVVSGGVKKNIVQSSVTVNKVIHNSHAQNRKREGMVASKMNITLHEIKDITDNIQSPSNPQSTGNLVYNYNTPSENESSRRLNKNNYSQGRHRHSHNSKNSGESHESSDSRSTDSGSWEDNNDNYLEPRPTMTEAPEIPMSPLFIGNNGNSIRKGNKIDVVKATRDIAQRIANDIQKPNSILEEETLERYTTLSKVIRTMSAEQIAQAQRDLYQPKQSPNQLNQNNREENTRRKAWEVFRDAVAQSGTGPALINIKQWIQNKQIKGMEAASVVDNIARTARFPNTEFTDTYFEMVKMPEIKEDLILKKAIVMSFADLMRHVAVDKRSSHHRYPVHAFGRLYQEAKKNLEEKYIPYLGEKLKSAIDTGDSEKVLTFTTALGKTGHSRMLSVFEPYLEGKKQVSEFQRNTMVFSLNKLAQLKPHHAQSVLNKIYMNTAESSDIRTSAVILLMETNPSAALLQRMAEYTHVDSDKQVNSAVKSAIESLAQLDEEENSELVNGARAALPLLTKEYYGPHFSKIFMKTIRNPYTGSKLAVQATWIGSEDTILGKGAYFRTQSWMKGVMVPDFEIGGSVSSTRSLYEFIQRAWKQNNQNKNNQKSQEQRYSPENIAKMLNIQGNDPEQLEGFLFANDKFENFFNSYDNRTLEKIGSKLRETLGDLKNGKNFDEIKLNNDEVIISFPTETGFPFRFTVRTPTLKSIEGKGNVEKSSDERDENGMLKQVLGVLKTNMVYSMKVQKRLSFVVPFEHQEYIAGMDRNVQFHLPIRSEMEIDQNKNEVRFKIQPNAEEREIKLVEYKAQPFTAKHDIFNLDPVAKDKNTQVLYKDRATKSRMALNDKNNQPALEMAWERQEKYSGDNENQEKKAEKALDKLTQSLMSFYYPVSAGNEYQKYSVKYTPSNDDSLEVRVSHDSLTTDNSNAEKYGNEDNQNPNAKTVHLSSSLDQRQRQEKLLKEVVKDINSAWGKGMDLKVQVNGRFQSSLTVSAAHGHSNVDSKSRSLLFASAKSTDNQDYNVRVGIENKIPKIYSMDFEDILKANNQHRSSVEIVYGKGDNDQKNGKVKINAKAEQTENRKNQVRQSNEAETCNRKKSQNGNKMSEACQKARARAYFADTAEVTVNFENAPALKNIAMNTIDLMQRMQNPLKTMKNRQDKEDKDRIKISLEASSDDQKLDITFKTPEGKIRMNDVDVNLLSSSINPRKDWFNIMTGQDNVCNLDKTKITTFDNLRYPVELGDCWHVILTTFPKNDPDMPSRQQEIPKNMHVTVLARETANRQKEFKVTLGDKEIELIRSDSGKPEAKINGQTVRLSKEKSHQEKKNEKIVLELFEAHDGAVKLVSNKYNFKMNYDGSRAEIKLGQLFRDSVRGLCGNYDTQYENDQETPKGCNLQKSEEFASTWALMNNKKCEGPARENIKNAQRSKCFDFSTRPGNVISEQEAGRRSQFNARRNDDEKDSQQCTHHRTRVMKDNQQICFSTRPVPTCSRKCREETTKEKPVSFHCVPRNSASEKIAQRVEDGANPDLSQKAVTKTETLTIPTSCKA